MAEKMVIGVTGENGAGKGTFIKILDELLPDYTVERISSGDLLGDILDLFDIPRTRENLQKLPVALEGEYGKGIVSEGVGNRILSSRADIVVFDGIRWDSDVQLVNHSPLVYVTADTKLRHERVVDRAEKAGESAVSFEEFKEQGKALTEVNIKRIGEEFADIRIDNNGTEFDLSAQVREFIKKQLGIKIFRRVMLETPFAGASPDQIEIHRNFARECIRQCLGLGEAAFASHLLYAQYGVLDDNKPEERELGMEAGFSWRDSVHATVVYTDLGISQGMQKGIIDSIERGAPVEYRQLHKY